MRSLLLKRIRQLLWQTSHSAGFLPLVGALAVAATLSMTVPVTAILLAAVMLRPRRWPLILLAAVLGAALGASALAWTFHEQGLGHLQRAYPEFSNSDSWRQVMAWIDHYGLFALAAVCALPLPQTPALIACGLGDLPISGIFLAVTAGKMAKYGVVAWMAATFPERFRRYLHKTPAQT